MARIIIVDDDPAVRGIMRRTLERAAHEIRTAEDGDAGIRLYREEPADLVITDLFMPGKEGIQTIQELREEFPDALILAVSGGGQARSSDVLVDAELFGANATLEKPFTPAQLAARVEALLIGRG